MEPLISVIVPVYNVEPYLRKCVDSILNQTYRNLEVILVDDGSPDGCPAICDEYAAKDDRVRVIHKENGGLPSARNAALEIAVGEYITFVDSDDWLDILHCERIMQQAPFEVALFGFTYVDAKTGCSHVKTVSSAPKKIFWDKNTDVIETLVRNSLFGYACNKMYHRSVLQDLRYPNIQLREDLLFNLLVYSRTESIQLIDCEGYFYLQHGQSLLKKAYYGPVPDLAAAAEKMGEIHPQMPKHANKELSGCLIKQYLCDAMYKYVFMNQALNEREAIGILRQIFSNRSLAKMVHFSANEGSMFTLLTICLKLRLSTIFYKLVKRKWHAQ